MIRWLERRSWWQLFIITLAAEVLAVLAGAMTSRSPDIRHMGLLGTLKHMVFFTLIMAACVTAGAQLGKAQRRRRANPGG
jgi:hypothetical protein